MKLQRYYVEAVTVYCSRLLFLAVSVTGMNISTRIKLLISLILQSGVADEWSRQAGQN